MIATKKNITKCKFGENGKASIHVNAFKNVVIFGSISTISSIGDDLKEEDVNSKSQKVELEFFEPESVDVVIKALLFVRNQIAKKESYKIKWSYSIEHITEE
jgi:hypothetical protein